MTRRLIAVIGLVLSSVAPARADVANCAAPRDYVESAVCGYPYLAKEDAKIWALYRDALPRLSERGKARLRESQKNWEEAVRFVCRPDETPASAKNDDEYCEVQTDKTRRDAELHQSQSNWQGPPKPDCKLKRRRSFPPGYALGSCLTNAYSSRSLNLRNAALAGEGGYVLTSEDRLKGAVFSYRDLYGAPGLTEVRLFAQDFSIPQIDAPDTESTRRFNKDMKDWLARRVAGRQDGGDPPDKGVWSVDFRATAMGPELISVILGESVSYPGAAHPYGSTIAVNFSPARNEYLKLDDLFASDKPWRKYLLRRTIELLKSPIPPDQEDKEAIASYIEENWHASREGLIVTIFNDLGVHLGLGRGDQPVTIPWADLQPYLRADAPVQNLLTPPSNGP